MSHRPTFFQYLSSLLIVGSLLCGNSSAEEREQFPTTQSVFREATDLAFEKLFDLQSLQKNLQLANVSGLVDDCCQLIHAEQILRRPHHTIDSNQLVRLTLRAALESGERQELSRLLQAADLWNRPELMWVMQQIKFLSESSRATDPWAPVRARKANPIGVVLYKSFLQETKKAWVYQDLNSLLMLKAAVSQLQELHPEHRKHLLTQMTTSEVALRKSSLPSDHPLVRLASGTRNLQPLKIVSPQQVSPGTEIPVAILIPETVQNARKEIIVKLTSNRQSTLTMPDLISIPKGKQVTTFLLKIPSNAPPGVSWFKAQTGDLETYLPITIADDENL